MVQPIPFRREKPTGRVSSRIGWFGRVIMRMEFEVRIIDSTPLRQQDREKVLNTFTYWRDAKKDDVIDMKVFDGDLL